MRPRNPANRALPINLYKNGRYYQYRHPQTGRYYGMGTDRAAAIRAAHQLNAQLIEPISLTERVLGTKRQALSQRSCSPTGSTPTPPCSMSAVYPHSPATTANGKLSASAPRSEP
jgi:hypothetical protein